MLSLSVEDSFERGAIFGVFFVSIQRLKKSKVGESVEENRILALARYLHSKKNCLSRLICTNQVVHLLLEC